MNRKVESCPRVCHSIVNESTPQTAALSVPLRSRTSSPAACSSINHSLQSMTDSGTEHSYTKLEISHIISDIFRGQPNNDRLSIRQRDLKANVEKYMWQTITTSEEPYDDFTLANRTLGSRRNSTVMEKSATAPAKSVRISLSPADDTQCASAKPQSCARNRRTLGPLSPHESNGLRSTSRQKAVNNRSRAMSLSEADIDGLVAELYNEDSQLSEQQQKLKADLEEYLINEVFSADEYCSEYTLATTDSEPEDSVAPNPIPPGRSPKFKVDPLADSIKASKQLFSWLIAPYKPQHFLDTYWQKKQPLLISARHANYFSQVISFERIRDISKRGKSNFDHSVRSTGAIVSSTCSTPRYWKTYRDGHPIFIEKPQCFFPEIHGLMCGIQEFLHSPLQAEIVVAPPKSKIAERKLAAGDLLILQVEGCSHVKVPSFEPGFDKEIAAGDCLYLPSDCVYSIESNRINHTLAVVVEIPCVNNYAQLLEKVVGLSLEAILASEPIMSLNFPLNCWNHLGTAYANINSKERRSFNKEVKGIFTRLALKLPMLIDAAFDELGKTFQQAALPPQITVAQRMHTVFGFDDLTDARTQGIRFQLTMDSEVRLLCADILYPVLEDDKNYYVYFRLRNDLSGQNGDAQRLEISAEEMIMVCSLMQSYPRYTKVADFEHEENASKLEIANKLWELGLIMLNRPVNHTQ